ncbi:MAG: hypothetical protein Q9167_003924 [Letrouitia subvulpina]
MPWSQIPSAIGAIFRPLVPPSNPSPSTKAPQQQHRSSSPKWTVRSSNLAVLFCLTRAGPRRPALPLELVLLILAHPTRWLRTASASLPAAVHVSDAQQTILTLGPLTAHEIHLLRKIVFTFRSKDQGWSSYPADHGTFRGSWTWFQLVITPDAGADVAEQGKGDQREHVLQVNRHAGRVMEDYRLEFEAGDEIVDGLREGDTLAVSACAAYPGWRNFVEEAGMEIWSLDDLGGRECEVGGFLGTSELECRSRQRQGH